MKLLAQKPEKLGESIKRLLADGNEPRRAAGEELLTILAKRKDEAAYSKAYLSCVKDEPDAAADAAPVKGATPGEYNAENGFGLYDPAAEFTRFSIANRPDPNGKDGVRTIFPITMEEMEKFIAAFEAAISEHADYQYKTREFDDRITDAVLGAHSWLSPVYKEGVRHTMGAPTTLDAYPLPEVWRGVASSLGVTPGFLICFNRKTQFDSKSLFDEWLGSIKEPWFKGLVAMAKHLGKMKRNYTTRVLKL